MSDISRVCKPDPHRGVYVLGGLSFRVSLHTQQRRVIALIDSLANELEESSDVAVVGGGVAGVTCAAALVQKGLRVSLFEQAEELMPLQGKNTTRFIHPNSVTWPYTDLRSSTDLPFLNWHSAYSDEVASIIEDEFLNDFVGRSHDEINIELRSRVLSVTSDGAEHMVEYINDDGTFKNKYKAVFITSGFGRERKISGYDNFSYWEDTSPTPIGSRFDDIRIAVIGDGDGALLELVRCVWRDVNLDELYRFLAKKFLKDKDVADRTKAVEEEARQVMKRDISKAHLILGDHYLSDTLSANGKNYLRSRKDLTADITLVSKEARPFSPRASPIHKILLGFLVNEQLIKVAQLEAMGVSFNDSRYWIEGKVSGTDAAPLGPFHRVLERLGPEREFCPLIKSTFEADVLAAFAPINSVEFDFANPINCDTFNPQSLVVGPNCTKKPIEVALDKLARYFRNTYPNALADLSVGKTEDTQEPCFVASFNLGNDDLRKDGPLNYLGYRILYQKSEATPRALGGRAADGFEGSTKLRCDPVTASQPITNISRSDHHTLGQITAFIRPLKSDESGEAHLYFMTAAHAVLARPNDKIGLIDGHETRRIGKIDTTRFASIMCRWQQDPEYICLKDVVVVRVDYDVVTENRAGSDKIESTRSSLDHLLTGDGRVYVKGKEFGYIERARANAVILDPEGHPIRTNGFFVRKTDPDVDVTAGSSGRPMFTGSGDIVGMILAGNDDLVFCLDVEEVLSKMECSLA